MRDLRKNPLQIGILGCGSFLLRRVLPVVKHMETVKIVAIQNRDLEKAKKIALEYNIPHAVSHREDLVEKSEVEAVHIASPNFLHEEDALACAAARKPTLCEKPLSTSLESVRKMIAAFEDRSLPFFVGQHLRFKPAIHKAKELLENGELGQLLHLRAYYYSQTIPADNWRLKKGNGGGALQEIGIHLVDLIHFITGEEISSAHAIAMPVQDGESERMVAFQGQLPSGATASFECAFERPYYNGFELIGTKSRLVSRESLRQTSEPIETLSLISATGKEHSITLEPCDLYVEEFKHFAEAVTHNIPTPISANIALASQRVIDHAYRTMTASLKKNREALLQI